MTTMATMTGNWRRRAGGRLMHLYRNGAPVCGVRVTAAGTTRVPRGTGALADVCYDCLAYGASGR